ncbi:LacI family DNA-binding transcriptional regulator [Agaribacterium haliotis]|uniref:LacI family DNA-binding transcriptional regulator n=1 Tax=Agaribacterium haliotis TaxID=2013869 RepID=UPI000BB54839|nr:LacI family DNA-binding transcriptional regulator [Agaribacterium haliotis]
MAEVGIKDVARKAGVSPATVSHALRNPGRVAEATRKKVLKAIDEVGYTPNKLGVSLRTSKSGNIVVIIPDISDSYNSGIIKAIEHVAHARGYSVLLGDSQCSEQREREYAAMVRSRQADGIILFSHRLPFDESDVAANRIPPIVNGGEYTGVKGVPAVTIDDLKAGFDATSHLIELGHSNIAVITGAMDSPTSQKRLQGFEKAMRQAKLSILEKNIIRSDYTVEAGESAAKQLLMLKERPSAIFCFSDEIALGAMHTLKNQGFEVPTDISVIGVDNIKFAKYFSPPLTTIAQPAEFIGETCARLLMDLLDGKKPEQDLHVLEHKLIIRNSTAAPKK